MTTDITATALTGTQLQVTVNGVQSTYTIGIYGTDSAGNLITFGALNEDDNDARIVDFAACGPLVTGTASPKNRNRATTTEVTTIGMGQFVAEDVDGVDVVRTYC